MSDALALTESTVHLAARNSGEIEAAKQYMVAWFTRKVGEITEELTIADAAAKYAKEHKWNHAALDGQASRIRKRLGFYEKVLAAIQAGYTIIPDIPIDLFAIRVKRETPNSEMVTVRATTDWEKRQNYLPAEEDSQRLPVGEGRYENPTHSSRSVERHTEREVIDGKETALIKKVWAIAFDEMEFPIIAAHPAIMNATQEAMSLRIFDQIGVSPQGRRRGDPLIIGQVCLRQGWSTKTISFLIGWNINLRTL